MRMSRQLAVLPLALSTLGAMQTVVAFSPSHVTLRHSTGLSRAAVTSSRQQLAFAPPAKALRGLRNLSMGIFDDLSESPRRHHSPAVNPGVCAAFPLGRALACLEIWIDLFH